VTVVLASLLQYLLAATFVIMPAIAYRYGDDAQRAAEAEVVKQGFATDVFPAGFRYLVITRFALTTVGSLLVITLLTIPPTNAYFH